MPKLVIGKLQTLKQYRSTLGITTCDMDTDDYERLNFQNLNYGVHLPFIFEGKKKANIFVDLTKLNNIEMFEVFNTLRSSNKHLEKNDQHVIVRVNHTQLNYLTAQFM